MKQVVIELSILETAQVVIVIYEHSTVGKVFPFVSALIDFLQ